MSRRAGVNVTRALLTGMRVGAKVASEVVSPAQTDLRRVAAPTAEGYLNHGIATPTRHPSGHLRGTAGEVSRRYAYRSASTTYHQADAESR